MSNWTPLLLLVFKSHVDTFDAVDKWGITEETSFTCGGPTKGNYFPRFGLPYINSLSR